MKTNTNDSKPSLKMIARFAGLLTLSLPLSSGAALLLYDGFDYAAGSIVGQNGGAGFATAWANSGTAAASSVSSSGAGYTDSVQNQLVSNGGKLAVSATNTSGVFRTFNPIAATAESTTTYWVSFIGNTSGLWAQAGGTYNAGLVLRNGNTELLAVGAFGTSAAWRARANGVTYSGTTGVPSSLNEAFIVLRIDVDTTSTGNDAVHLWVNPGLNTAPSIALTTASITGSNLWGADQFSLSLLRIGTFDGGALTSKGIALDELRIGTDFSSVAPIVSIPEPSTFGILSGSLMLAVVSVRRRGR